MSHTRRDFLINGLRVSAAVPLLARTGFTRPEARRDRALVVVQLSGGNDGLNTVVPLGQDEYYRLRPFLGLGRDALHVLDDAHALHPQLGGLAELFHAGSLAIVEGIGCPDPDRSHFRSLEMWHSAQPQVARPEVGWLGRLADQLVDDPASAMPALAIQDGPLPLSLRGERTLAPTVPGADGLRLTPVSERIGVKRAQGLTGDYVGDLAFLRDAAQSAYASAQRMEELALSDASADYPESRLAQQLRFVAQLIRGKFGTRIFHVSLDGFDTHARQKPLHDALMGELGGALTAFQRDLERSGDAHAVATFVFSEFGRRARENGSKGTDHGSGAPAFVLGPAVRAGFHGHPADLTALVGGDVPVQVDFRQVYTALESDWLGLRPSSDVTPLELF